MTEINDTKCPICGENNSCQYSMKNNTAQKSCWCENSNYIFSDDIFTHISDKLKDKTCVCESCVKALKKNK